MQPLERQRYPCEVSKDDQAFDTIFYSSINISSIQETTDQFIQPVVWFHLICEAMVQYQIYKTCFIRVNLFRWQVTRSLADASRVGYKQEWNILFLRRLNCEIKCTSWDLDLVNPLMWHAFTKHNIHFELFELEDKIGCVLKTWTNAIRKDNSSCMYQLFWNKIDTLPLLSPVVSIDASNH